VRLMRRRTHVTVAAANRYLGLGAEQARRLGQAHTGSEHVLLGLATQPGGAAAVALEHLGATPQLIEADIRGNPSTPPPTAIDPHALATLGIRHDRTHLRSGGCRVDHLDVADRAAAAVVPSEHVDVAGRRDRDVR